MYIFINENTSGAVTVDGNLNNNFGSVYSFQRINNNGTIVTGPNEDFIPFSSGVQLPAFSINFMTSQNGESKGGYVLQARSGGEDATAAPRRMISLWKSSIGEAINRMDFENSNNGIYNTDTTVIILGAD